MTIRITVHNDGAMPGRVVGVRTLSGVEDTSPGDPVFLHPGEWMSFYLYNHQFIVAAECPDSLGPRGPETHAPKAPLPVLLTS